MVKLRYPVTIHHIHLKGVVFILYHTISFLWQIFFQIARKFMNLINLSSSPSYNSILTLMKLFLLPFGSISMHQRAEPANTL